MSDKINYSTRTPDFSRSGRFDESIPASRWLARLAFDLKKGDGKILPEEFLEAVEILLDGDAAMWLDSSKMFRDIIDNKQQATENDVEALKEALKAEFPIRVVERTEGNVQQEIRSFQQLPEEPLLTYYGRAKHLLRRAYGRDEPVQVNTGMLINPLSPLEKMMLSGIVSAFVEGLFDAELRSLAIRRSVMGCGSLLGAYQIVQDTKLGMETEREVEARLAKEREYLDLKALVLREFGRPASTLLAEFNSGSRVNRSEVLVQTEDADMPFRPVPAKNAFQIGTGNMGHGEESIIGRGEPSVHKSRKVPVSSSMRPPEDTSSLPPNSMSRNPFVNGTRTYRKDKDGQLCIRCGSIGHIGSNCPGQRLENWEQVHLRNLIFHDIQPGQGTPIESKVANFAYDNCQGSWRWCNQGRATSNVDQNAQLSEKTTGKEVEGLQSLTFEQLNGNKHEDHILSGRNFQGNSVSLGNGSDGFPTVTFESYLGEQSRKRQRVEVEDIINDGSGESVKRAQRKSRARKGQSLTEIVGRQGKGPLDYTKLVEEMIFKVSLLDLYQMSPDLSRAFRKLSTRISKRTDRRGKSRVEDQAESEVLLAGELEDLGLRDEDRCCEGVSGGVNNLQSVAPLISTERKAFRVPVVVKTSKNGTPVNVVMPTEVSQADQGSDMIVVTIGFLRALGISTKPLSDIGYHNLTMNVADGRSAKLTHCCTLTIGVLGVWRKVDAFVRPYDESNKTEVHLLLGMPWLHSVDAKIHIRASKIELGDVKRGEKVVE